MELHDLDVDDAAEEDGVEKASVDAEVDGILLELLGLLRFAS